MNTLINLSLVTEKNGILVLLVMVWVSSAPLAFGGLMSSMFPGTPVLTLLHPPGPRRKLITLRRSLPVLLLFVILPNPTLALLLIMHRPVLDPLLNSTVPLLVLFTLRTPPDV